MTTPGKGAPGKGDTPGRKGGHPWKAIACGKGDGFAEGRRSVPLRSSRRRIRGGKEECPSSVFLIAIAGSPVSGSGEEVFCARGSCFGLF